MSFLHGHSGLSMIFNWYRQDRIFPCPLIIVATFGFKCKFTASLLSTLGKSYLVIAPFVVSSHWFVCLIQGNYRIWDIMSLGFNEIWWWPRREAETCSHFQATSCKYNIYTFDIRGSVHRRLLSRNNQQDAAL